MPNLSNGSIIGKLNVEGLISGDLSFSIINGNDDNIFEINPNTGVFKLINSEFILNKNYHFLKCKIENDNEFVEKIAIFKIKSSSKEDVLILTAQGGSLSSLDENSIAETVVGQILINDNVPSSDEDYVFTIEDIDFFGDLSDIDISDNIFSINNLGEISVNTPEHFLNFELFQNFTLTIRAASTSNDDFGIGNFTISLNDVEPEVLEDPTINQYPEFNIDEDQPGMVITLTGITNGRNISGVDLSATSNDLIVLSLDPFTTVDLATEGEASLTFTPNKDANGDASITVTARNLETDVTKSMTIDIVINPINDRPRIFVDNENLDGLPIAEQFINENETAEIEISGIWDDGDGLDIGIYSPVLNVNPEAYGYIIPVGNYSVLWDEENPDVATIIIDPVDGLFDLDGIPLSLRIVDKSGTPNGGDGANFPFNLIIRPVNDSPTMDAITDPEPIDEDFLLQEIIVTGITDGSILESDIISVFAESITDDIIADGNINVEYPLIISEGVFDSTQAKITYVSIANSNGIAQIKVTVYDDGGVSDGGINEVIDTINIVINAVNDPPNIGAINVTSILEDSDNYTIMGILVNDGDPEEQGDLITTTTIINGEDILDVGATIYNSETGEVSIEIEPQNNEFGQVELQLSVTDGAGGNNNSTQNFTVFVTSINDEPTISLVEDQDIIENGTIGILEDADFQIVHLNNISVGNLQENNIGQEITNFAAVSNNIALIEDVSIINIDYDIGIADLKFKPIANANGNCNITITIVDDGLETSGNGDDNTKEFVIPVVVEKINDAPTLNDISNVSTNEEEAEGGISVNLFGISDGDFEANTVQEIFVTAVENDDADLIGEITVNYTYPATDANIVFQALPDANGTTTITVIVTDEGSGELPHINETVKTFTITISEVNSVPTITQIDNQVIFEDNILEILLTGISDGDGSSEQILSVDVSFGSPDNLFKEPVTTYIQNENTATLILEPNSDATGTNFIYVTITDDETIDGISKSITMSFQVEVQEVNDEPTISVIDNISILEDHGVTEVALLGITDGDGGIDDIIAVTANSDSEGILIENLSVTYPNNNSVTTALLSFSTVDGASGTATINVVVQDEGGTANGGDDTKNVSFEVFIAPLNDAPVIDEIETLYLDEDAGLQIINLTGIGDGDDFVVQNILSLTIESSNNTLISNPIEKDYTLGNPTGSFSFTPESNRNGTSTITITIKDDGGTASDGIDTKVYQFDVVVADINDAPTISQVEDLVDENYILEGAGEQQIDLTGITDGDNGIQNILSITATSDNEALIGNIIIDYETNDYSGALRFTPTEQLSGNVVITVTVQDDAGTNNGGVDIFEMSFNVHVESINNEPTIAEIDDVEIIEDYGVYSIILGSITDGDIELEQNLTVTANIESSNANLISVPSESNNGITYDTPSNPPTGIFRFTPNENENGVAFVTITVQDDGPLVPIGSDNTKEVTFSITVNSVNDVPIIETVNNFLISDGITIDVPEDAGDQILNIGGIDDGDDEVQQEITSITAVSDNPSLIPNTPEYLSVNYVWQPNATLGYVNFKSISGETGIANITLTIFDNGGVVDGGSNTMDYTFTIDVGGVNDAPTAEIVGGNSVVILEDANEIKINLSNITDGDDEDQNISIVASSLNQSLIPDPIVVYTQNEETGEIKFTPVSNANGNVDITIIITDNGATPEEQVGANNETIITLNVEVIAVNDAPELSADGIEDLNITEDAGEQIINLSGITDGDNGEQGIAGISWVSDNLNLINFIDVNYTPNNLTGDLSFTTLTGAFGDATITVTVTDNGNTENGGVKTFSRTFDVNVASLNDAPTVNPADDQLLDEDETGSFLLTGITDGDENTQFVTITATSSNGAIIPDGNINISSYSNSEVPFPNNNTAVLEFTPALGVNGECDITVILTDNGLDNGGNVNVGTMVFNVKVADYNDTPLFTSNPFSTITEDQLYTYNITANDEEGDPITFSFTDLPTWLSLVDHGNGTATLSGTPLNENNTDNISEGDNDVVITIRDNMSADVEQIFTIAVAPLNDPPEITSLPVPLTSELPIGTRATANFLYTYEITATDEEGENITLELGNVDPVANWLSIVDNGDGTATLSGTPPVDLEENFSVTITASDESGAIGEQIILLQVSPDNFAPFFTSTPVEGAFVGNVYTYSIVTLDVEQENLTITSTASSWLNLVDNADGTATLSGTPSEEHLGQNNMTIFVEDATSGLIEQVFTINVTNFNEAPVFTSISPESLLATEDENYSITIFVTDAENSILNFGNGVLPNWLSFSSDPIANSITLTGKPLGENVGNNIFTLTAHDGIDITEKIIIIDVSGVDDLPIVANPINNVIVNEDAPNTVIDLTDVFTDEDNANIDITKEVFNPKPTLLTAIIDGNTLTLDYLEGQSFPTAITIIVTGTSNERSVTTEFQVTVNDVNDLPIISSNPDETINENILYEYTITATDEETAPNNLIFVGEILPNWLSLSPSGDGSAVLSGTPNYENIGLHTVVLSVRDENSGSKEQQFIIEVENVNDAPEFTSEPITSVVVNSEYNYSITATDLDEDANLSFDKIGSLPDWIILTDNGDGTATLSGTPSEENIGDNFEVKLTLSDEIAEQIQTFFIVVNPINQAPSFPNEEPIFFTINENIGTGGMVGIINEAIDPEEQELTYSIKLGNTNNAFVLNERTITVANNNAIDFETMPSFTLVIEAKDNPAGEIEQKATTTEVIISINDVNEAPNVSTQLLHISENENIDAIVGNVNATDFDLNDQVNLTYSFSNESEENVFEIDEIGNIILKQNLDFEIVPNYQLTVKVTDDENLFTEAIISISVENVNESPIIETQTYSVDENEANNFYIASAIASDPDAGQNLFFEISGGNFNNAFSIHSNTGVITVNNSEALDFETVTENKFALTIRVTDDGEPEKNSEGIVYIELTDLNEIPLISDIPNQTILETNGFEPINLDFYVNDEDANEVLTWTKSSLNNLSISIEDGYAYITSIDENWFGTENVMFTVTDEDGLSVSDEVIFKINSVNDAPVVTDIPPQTISEGETFTQIYLDDFCSDIEDTDEDIIWADITATNLIITINDRVATITVKNINWGGTETVTFTAYDTDGGTDYDNVSFTVISINDAPIIEGQNPLSASEDQENIEFSFGAEGQGYDIVVSDVDHPISALSISIKEGANYTTNGTTITPIENFNGDLIVNIAISDGTDESEIFEFHIEITPVNDAPEIVGQNNLETDEEVGKIITVNDLEIYLIENENEDINNFTLHLSAGENYILNQLNNNEVIPDENFFGTLYVPTRVHDGGKYSETFTLEIIVNNVNDAPEIIAQTAVITEEETAVEIQMSNLNVIDIDNVYPENFTIIVQEGDIDNYSYENNIITPNENVFGFIFVNIIVNDGEEINSNSETFPLKVFVGNENDAPVITGQNEIEINEGELLEINLSDLIVEDSDNSFPAEFTLNADFEQADENFFGILNIPVSVNDGELESNVYDVKVTINNVNDAPVIEKISEDILLTTPLDSVFIFNMAYVNITDIDNIYPDDFTFEIDSLENCIISEDSILQKDDLVIGDTLKITIKVNDGNDDSNILNFDIIVTDPDNEIPSITSYSPFEMEEDDETGITFDISNIDDFILAGISDDETANLQILNGSNYNVENLTIKSKNNFFGDLEVLVILSDGFSTSAIDTIIVTVTPVNDPPTITSNLEINSPEEIDLEILVSQLIIEDPDSEEFSIIIENGANYSFDATTVTPENNFFGNLPINIRVSDGSLLSDSYVLNVNIENVNDIPIINTYNGIMNTDEGISFNLNVDDFIIEDDDNDTEFTLIIQEGDNYIFEGTTITPAPNFDDPIDILVKVSDGIDESPIFTIEDFIINSVNDVPIIHNATTVLSMNEDELQGLQIVIGNLNVTDADHLLNQLTLSVQSGENYELNGNVVVPADNFYGDLTVPVIVQDPSGGNSIPYDLTVTVNPVNDAPVINSQLYDLTIPMNTSLEIEIGFLDISDVDNNYEDFNLIVSQNSNYSVNDNTIIPNENYVGELVVRVKIDDQEDENNTSGFFNLIVNVTDSENIAPEIAGQISLITEENTSVDIEMSHLIIIDPDSEEFTLNVFNGNNYSVSDGKTITPDEAFIGTLNVLIIINDGNNDSEAFDFEIFVTNEEIEIPEIIGQSNLSVRKNTDFEILLPYLFVVDNDSNYPTDFTLSIFGGDNYSLINNVIIPDPDFVGILNVPATVNDGTNNSNIFILEVIITNAVNDIPEITSCVPLSIYKESTLNFVLSYLTVEDDDNNYPDDFSLTVLTNANYTLDGNTIIPDPDFEDNQLNVPVIVNDGSNNSEIFDVYISLTDSENNIPEITSQSPDLSSPEDEAFNLLYAHLIIEDSDNAVPIGFSIFVLSGENYTAIGNEITPNENFVGDLIIPIIVSDGTNTSEIFNFELEITAVNDPPVIISQIATLTTQQNVGIEILPSHLQIEDIDNNFDDFFIVYTQAASGNYYIDGNNQVVPTTNLSPTIPVRISDGIDESEEIFYVAINVTQENNSAPVITSSVNLSTPVNTSIEIITNYLIINDIDNNYPEDFTLSILFGDNYTSYENIITPSNDFVGTLIVNVMVSDGINSSNVYPINVGVDDIETIQTIISQADENLNTNEETALEITLSDLTSDNLNFPNGCTLTVLLGENYSYGGTNEIIPNENFVGTLYVPVFVNDGISISNTIELIVTVNNTNDLPTIFEQTPLSVLTNENLEISLNNLIYSDIDGDDCTLTVLEDIADPITYFIVEDENNTITNFVVDFVGNVTVFVELNDGTGTIQYPMQVTFLENLDNEVPVITSADNDLVVQEDADITLILQNVNVNDADNIFPTDFTLYVLDGENYNVENNIVTPYENFDGNLNVNVIVNDGTNNSNIYQINIDVTPVNDKPQILSSNIEFETLEETYLEINIFDLNIFDIESNEPFENFQLIILDGDNYDIEPQNVITPIKDFYGKLLVPIKIKDDDVFSEIFILEINVTNDNDSPLIVGQNPLETNEETALTLNVIDDLEIYDVDNVEGDFTLEILNGSNYEIIDENTIKPHDDFVGELICKVKVSDLLDDSGIYNLIVNVSNKNDPPIVEQIPININENTELEILLSHLIITDVDNDSFELTVLDENNLNHYTIDGNNVIPETDYDENLIVKLQISDGEATVDFDLNITINPVNNIPVIVFPQDSTLKIQEEATEEITVELINDYINVIDADDNFPDGFTVQIYSGEYYILLDGNEIITTLDFNGNLTVPITVTDNLGAISNVFDFNIEVTHINDDPIITNQNPLNVDEDSELIITIGNLVFEDPDIVEEENLNTDDFSLVILNGVNYEITEEGINEIKPKENFNGELYVPVKVIDNDDTESESNIYNLLVNVNPINDEPYFIEDTELPVLNTDEDIAIEILISNVINNFDDIDNLDSDLSLVVFSGSNYNFENNEVTPATDYVGTISVNFKICDIEDCSIMHTIDIEINPVNDAPVVNATTITKFEDEVFYLIIGNNIIVEDVDYPQNELSLIIDGGLNYTVDDENNEITPDEDFYGTLIIPVKANDGFVDGEFQDITVILTPVNDEPQIDMETYYEIPEDTTQQSITINGLNDGDEGVEQEILNITATSNNHEIILDPIITPGFSEGSFILTYTPLENANGTVEITIHIKDDGGIENDGDDQLDTTFIVEVIDINDLPNIASQNLIEIQEDDENGLEILFSHFNIEDEDNSDNNTENDNTFSLEILDSEGYGDEYSVQVGTTIVNFNENFYGEVTIPVMITDNNGGASETFYAKVNVIPVNDIPEIADYDNTTIDEDNQLKLLPSNFGVYYDLDNSINDLVLTINEGVNYTVASDNVTVIPNENWNGILNVLAVLSDGQLDSLYNFEITVNSINDNPVIIEQTGEINIDEESEFSLSIVDYLTTEDVENNPLTPIILDGNNYTFDGNVITPIADFFGELIVNIQVNDGQDENNLSDIFQLEILVANINDKPVINSQATSLSVLEEGSLLIANYDLNVTDVDNVYPNDFNHENGLTVLPGDNYTVIDNTITPNEDFPFNSNIGILNVQVIVNDGELDSDPEFIIVSVINVNDAPKIIGLLENITIDEDNSRTIDLLEDFNFNDVDSDNEELNLTVLVGANYNFVGNIITPIENFNGTLTVPVTVNDGYLSSPIYNVEINVIPINDAPTDILLSNNLISQDAVPNTIIGELSTEDVDILTNEDTHLYEIVIDDASYPHTNKFIILGNTLFTTDEFNSDVEPEYIIKIKSIDVAGDFYEKEITINVDGYNIAPTMTEGQTGYIKENSSFGKLVTDVQATDVNLSIGQILTYSITETSEGYDKFEIDASSGKLTVSGDLDYEEKNIYKLEIEVQDNGIGKLSDKDTLTVYVQNENETPFIQYGQEFFIDENSKDNTSVGNVEAEDVDIELHPEQTLSYSIIDFDDEAPFKIDPAKALISVNNSLKLDYEMKTEYIFDVKVEDSEGLFYIEKVTVYLNDKIEETVKVNNFFSPNGDGVNDRWKLKNSELYEDCNFKIFNNWGELVLDKIGREFISEGWDCTYDNNGTDVVPADVYYYIIECDGHKVISGSITIVK